MADVPDKPSREGLAFDFAKAAQKAMRDYPEETKNLVVSDGDNNGSIIVENFKDSEKFLAEIAARVVHERMREKGSLNHAQAMKVPMLDDIYTSLYLRHCTEEINPFQSPDLAVSDAYVFDHELGHLVVKTAMDETPEQPNLTETSADAFALIRHYQRYGMDSPLPIGYITANAMMFLSGLPDTGHTTLWALDQIRLDAKTADFMSLTPAETAKLAEEYARKFTPAAAEMHKLREDYAELLADMAKNQLQFDLNDLATAVLKQEPGSLAFHLGVRTLQYAFDKYPEDAANAGWQKIRQALEQKIAGMGDAGNVLADFIENKKDVTREATALAPQPVKSPAAPVL